MREYGCGQRFQVSKSRGKFFFRSGEGGSRKADRGLSERVIRDRHMRRSLMPLGLFSREDRGRTRTSFVNVHVIRLGSD